MGAVRLTSFPQIATLKNKYYARRASLDFSNWNTSNATNMNLMLNDMRAPKELTFGQNFNTTNLTAPTDKKLVLPNTVASSDLTQAKMWCNVDSTKIDL